MNGRVARSLRGTAFAAIATTAAAIAHTAAGGGAPSPLFCLTLAALVLPMTVAIAGPRVSPVRTWLAMGLAQMAFHLAFSVTGDLVPAGSPRGGHGSHSLLGALPPGDVAVEGSPAMSVAHLLAAVAVVVAVRRGERVIQTILGWVRRALHHVALPVFAPAVVRRVTPAHRARPACPRVAREPLSRRGPPTILSPAAL